MMRYRAFGRLSRTRRRQERGYLLLFLIFALAAMIILLTMRADTSQIERQREREAEFIVRGCAVAKAIARYNNAGRIAPLNPGAPFPLKLSDLTKEVNVNGQRLRLLRPSALRDPFTGNEWRVVCVGDPLIRRYLERWSSFTGQPVPASYVALTASVVNQGGFGGNFDPSGGCSPSRRVRMATAMMTMDLPRRDRLSASLEASPNRPSQPYLAKMSPTIPGCSCTGLWLPVPTGILIGTPCERLVLPIP